jgi:hypothetical protein
LVNKKGYLSFLLFFVFFIGNSTRGLCDCGNTIINNAVNYRDYSWICTEANARTTNADGIEADNDLQYPFFPAGEPIKKNPDGSVIFATGQYTGEVYAWSLRETEDIFNNKLAAGVKAGNIDNTIEFSIKWHDYTGIDCSGFVENCVGIPILPRQNYPYALWHPGTINKTSQDNNVANVIDASPNSVRIAGTINADPRVKDCTFTWISDDDIRRSDGGTGYQPRRFSPPYLQKVTIYQYNMINGAPAHIKKFAAGWSDVDSATRTKNVSLNNCAEPGKIYIVLEFSKAMAAYAGAYEADWQDITVTVKNMKTGAEQPVKFLEEGLYNDGFFNNSLAIRNGWVNQIGVDVGYVYTKWVGQLDINDDAGEFGENQIEVDATSLMQDKLDRNPATAAVRTSNGAWNSYESVLSGESGTDTETGGVDKNNKFVIAPKGSVIFKGANGDNDVFISNDGGTPTPVPTDTSNINYPATAAATNVNVADYIKGIMYGATCGADFSGTQFKEGYKAIGIAAYTLLLHEQNINAGNNYDVLVNGYSDGQKYFIPYKDYSKCTGSIKTAIDTAFSEIAVTTTASDGTINYYIKAYWLDNTNANNTYIRDVDNATVPNLKTLIFPFIDKATGLKHVTNKSEKEIGEYIPYLHETAYDEDIASVTKADNMINCTKIGMSAWGAMKMASDTNSPKQASDILNLSFHYQPVYLERLKVIQTVGTADSAGNTAASNDGTTQTAYDYAWDKAVFQAGQDIPVRLSSTANVIPKGVEIADNPTMYLYFSEAISANTVMLKNVSTTALVESLPLILEPVTDPDITKGYAQVFKTDLTKADTALVLKAGESGTLKVCVSAQSKYYNDNFYNNDITKTFINATPGSGYFYIVDPARSNITSTLHSDEYHELSFINAADYDSSSTKTSYSNAFNVTNGASVSLSLPDIDLGIDWATLLKSLIPDFSRFDLLGALKDLLPDLDFKCLTSEETEQLKSVNLQSADVVAGGITSNMTVSNFLKNKLNITIPACLDAQLKGMLLGNLFKIPSVKIPGININLPRPDLKGCKWGLDTSGWKIAWFPDKLQGPDTWKYLAGMFKLSLGFRGINPPQLLFINMNAKNLSLGDWQTKGNLCGAIDSGISGAMNELMPIKQPGDTGNGNTKIAADGMGGNGVLDFLSNTTTGLGNTTNAHIADDLTSVAIAGAFLSSGTGIDQNAINDVMYFQTVAKDVSVGMALLGGIQMISNPGFGQYLLQGAVGYVKTWAEGTIKAYAFRGLDAILDKGISDLQLDSIADRLPGGSNFPGYGGVKSSVSSLKNLINSGSLASSIMGCSANDSDLPDLNNINISWDDVMDVATKVATYIDNYDGTKNDLVSGGKWLTNFADRDISAITSNLSKIKNLTLKASGGSGSSPLTVNESMMSTLGQVLQLLHVIPEPITSGIANIGPIIVSIFNTSNGNLLSTVENQLGSNNPAIQGLKSAIAEKGTAIFKELKIGDFPNFNIPLPINVDFLPFIGDLINEVMGSLSFGKGQQLNPGEILDNVDQPGEVGVFYPYSGNAKSPLTSYNGSICGVTTNNSVLHTEGWGADYFPQFLQVYAQADSGPVVTTVLKIDTTLVTTADGKEGKADWALDIPLPHAGANTVKIWTINAGGHRVDMQFTAYLDGTSFPQEGSRAIPVSSFIWTVSSNGIAGIGSQVLKQGGGIINYLNADPGKRPLSDIFTVDASMHNDAISVSYPDNTADPDLEIVDVNGNIISTVPSDGRFQMRLKNIYTGKSFVTVMGAADAMNFRQWRLEYAPGWLNSDAGDNSFTANSIVISNDKEAGPLFNVMTSWDVWSKRLYGEYTIRTTVDDDNEGYYYVSSTAEVDRAHFTIGTPIDVSNTAGTIVTDPYMKFQVYVPAGALTQTAYVNIYAENSGPVNGFESDQYAMMTSKFGIYPPLDSGLLAASSTGLTITVKYTDDDLYIQNFDADFDLAGAADYDNQKAKAENIIAQNLGIYRETDGVDSTGATKTAMELLKTEHPLGTYTIYTVQPGAKGKYFVLPASCAPILRYPTVASPFIFDPEEEAKGRTCTAFYIFPMTAASKYVFADIKIMPDNSTRVVRDLYDGIENKQPITLKYSGKYGDIDEYNNTKYYFYNFDETVNYRNILAAPLNGIVWDGKGTRRDGTQGIVEDGVYRAAITLMDPFGNSTTGSALVVKGRIVPQITQIGGIAAADGMSLSAANRPDGIAAVLGTATGAEAFKGYRIGYRPSNYISDTGSNDPDEGYTYINLPLLSTAGAVTTTAYNVQINDGTLADLDVASMVNGDYDLRLFILGTDDSGNTGVLDRATINNIHVQTPPGINNLQGNPNPFASVVTLTADVYTTDYSPVTFTVIDSAGVTLAQISGTNIQGLKYQAVWDASAQPDSYFTVSVTADTFEKDIKIRKYSSTDDIKAAITSPAAKADVTGDITVVGSAGVTDSDGQTLPVKMQYYEVYSQADGGDWTLVNRSMDSVSNDWLANIPINGIKGNNLNIKLFVIDSAGNSEISEVDGINIKFNSTLAVSPQTYVRGIGEKLSIDYTLNQDADSVTLYSGWGASQGGPPASYMYFTLTDDDLKAGDHRIYWDGQDYLGKVINIGGVPIRMTAVKNGNPVSENIVYITSCDASQVTDMPGVTMDAYGEPKPFFDFTATGAGMYDKPMAVTYTVTGYATENWVDQHSIEPSLNKTSSCWGCNTSDNFKFYVPYNQTLAWTASTSGCGNGDWEITWNGNSYKSGSGSDEGNFIVNRGDTITGNVNAKEGEVCIQSETTALKMAYYDINNDSGYSKVAGAIQGKDIIYAHRENSDFFTITFTAQNKSDWNDEPQHGVISNPFYPNNAATGQPLINVSCAAITSAATGIGGGLIPEGEHYYSVTDTVCSTCTGTANEKNEGTQSGTINLSYGKSANFNISAGLKATMAVTEIIKDFTVGITNSFNTNAIYYFSNTISVHADDIQYNKTNILPGQTINLDDQVVAAKNKIIGNSVNNGSIAYIFTVSGVTYSDYYAVADNGGNTLLSVDISNNSWNQDVFTCGVTVTAQNLTENWSIPTPVAVRDNVVVFNQGGTQTGQKVNIFQSLNNTYGGGINPFPNQSEAAQVTATGSAVPGPDSVPHTSGWTINGPMYPDGAGYDNDIVLAGGVSETSLTNEYKISFGSATSTADSDFGIGLTYDDYNIDKVTLKLREPSATPYDSITYVKISGTVNVANLVYYALSYKMDDSAENDVYHEFKRSTMTAQGVLGYLPVKDKIGAYDIMLSVVVNNSGDFEAYQSKKVINIGHQITAKDGGTATDAYEQAFLYFPAGALRQDKYITITPLKRNELPILQSSLIPASLIYSFLAVNPGESEGDHLRTDDFAMDSLGNIPKPAVLTITYDPKQLGGYDESTLSLYKLDIPPGGTQEELMLISSLVDKENHVITTELTSFSTVQLIPNMDPPSFQFSASPDPAGMQSVVDIYIKSTKTLGTNLTGSVTLPDLNVTYKNGRTVPLTFTRQIKPYMSGTTSVTTICTNSDYDPYQLILGNVGDAGMPCDGESNTMLAGTAVVFSYPGTNLPAKTYYINRAGTYSSDISKSNQSRSNEFWITLVDQRGNTSNEISVNSIINGTTNWSCIDPMNPSNHDSGTLSTSTNCTTGLTLINTAPGQTLAFPPVSWWNGKTIVIGANTYTLAGVQITGNEMTGAQVSASLIDASSNTVVVTDSIGNTPWTMFAPVSEYMAEFSVAANVPAGVSGQAEVDFSGVDMLGNTGGGQGYFYINTSMTPVSITTDRDIAKLGDTLLISAKSNLEGELPSINLYKYPSGVTLTVDPAKISNIVVTGTNILTGESTYQYVVGPPELDNYEGLLEAVAGVTLCSDNTCQEVYASKTITVDTKRPQFGVSLTNYQPLGTGNYNMIINASEPIAGLPQVKISALTGNGSGWESVMAPVTGGGDVFNAVMQVKATYVYSSITVEVLGYDLAGNTGTGHNTFTIDTRPPDQLKNLKGYRQNIPSAALNYIGNMLSWDSLTPTASDLAGYNIYRDNVLITAGPVTINAYADMLSGTGFDIGSDTSHTYYVAGVDRSGNIGAGSYLTIMPDSAAPVTVLDIIGNSYTASSGAIYFNSGSLIELNASDASSAGEQSSGVYNTGYNFNNPDPGYFNNYTTPFVCPYSNTPAAVYFRSTDKNGNTEAVKSGGLFMDTNPPDTVLDIIAPYWRDTGTVSAVGVTFPADITSWDRAAIVAELTTTASDIFTPAMVDSLLNTTETTDDEIKYDLSLVTAADTGSAKVLTTTAQAGSLVYINGNYSKLSITANDIFDGGGSGVKEIDYRIDASAPQTFMSGTINAAPFGVTYLAEGMHTIETTGVDNVGNNRAFLGYGSNLERFVVDDRAPSTTASIVYGGNTVTVSAGALTVTAESCIFSLNAVDNGSIPSGIYKTYYSMNGGSFGEYASPVTLTPGIYNLGYYSVDMVSNTENAGSLALYVIIPVQLEYKSGDNNNNTNSPKPDFKLDNISALTLDASKIEIRYWYEYEGTRQAETAVIDYAGRMNAGTNLTQFSEASIVTGGFGSGQNRYLSVSFGAGAGYLQPGDSLLVDGRFNKNDWSAYNQGNDWSYLNTWNFQVWNQVTVYYDGVLIWGIEPGTAGPITSPTAVSSAAATPSYTATITPSFTNTPAITATLTNTQSATMTPCVTQTSALTAVMTGTVTPIESMTINGTATQQAETTATGTATPETLTPDITPSNTAAETSTATITVTTTSTATGTAANSATLTTTATLTPSYTATRTRTRTITPSATKTLTKTATFTPTNTITMTSTATITPTITPDTYGITLEFKDAINDISTNSPHPWFRIYNNGSSAVDLSAIEIRYWYKFEGTNQSEQSCVDAAFKMVSGEHIENFTSSQIIDGSFGSQDRYLKIGFAAGAGSINPGEYAEVQARFNKTDWSVYDQGNDWSFTVFQDYSVWNNMTVYLDGALIWGNAPGGMGALSVTRLKTAKSQYEDLNESNTYNYPNPFSGETTIRFSLAMAEDVCVRIYDMNGSLVWKKNIEAVKAGINYVSWPGVNNSGERAAEGIYICEVKTVNKRVIMKMALIR